MSAAENPLEPPWRESELGAPGAVEGVHRHLHCRRTEGSPLPGLGDAPARRLVD